MVSFTSAVVLQTCEERLHNSRPTNSDNHADDTNHADYAYHAYHADHADHVHRPTT